MASYRDMIKKMEKDWNAPNLMSAAHAERGKKIPLSAPLMNYSLYGGIPRGKITEFYGEPSGGKSTTAVDACKNAIEVFKQEHQEEISRLQAEIAKGNKGKAAELAEITERGPRRVLYFDLEHSFDGAWAKTLGIDESGLDIMQPPDVVAEDILEAILGICETGEVGMMVLDSLPSLVPRSELEKKMGERTVASLAGLLSVFFRKLVPLLTRYDVTFIVINQIRDNMDNPYVIKTPGGQAPKFYASLRIYFRIGQPVDFLGNELPQNTENPAGYIVQAKITQQKSAPNNRRQGSYFLMCDSGLRPDFDFAKLAVSKYNIIVKAGAWFTVKDPNTMQPVEDGKGMPVKVNGMAKVYQYLQDHPDYYETLKTFILNDINGRPEEGAQDDSMTLL